MAITLQKTTKINVGVIVSQAVDAVRVIRNQESSRQESLFQSAIADGMSYDAQVKFRKDQLEKAKKQSFVDSEYINKLEESIASTKKLSRFYKYRQKYAESLAELNAGTINEIEYSKTLKNLLGQTEDVDLRAEIQTNITQSEVKVTTYKNTLLENQVKKAKYDGTAKVLDEAVEKVRAARTLAQIAGNEDDVEEYDLTISALNSQKVQSKAEDIISDIAVAGTMSEFNAKTKLDKLGSQVESADTEVPITIGGTRFNSEREYWEITRNAYLSGNGSGIFTDFFSELDTQYKTRIATDTAKFGFVTSSSIDAMRSEFERLRGNPDFAPFLAQIDSMEALVIASAVDTMAKVVVDRAEYTGDFTKADATLKELGNTYQVDTTFRQLTLGNILNQQVNASIAAGEGVPPEASLLPSTDFPIPGAPIAPTVTPAPTPTVPGAPVAPAGGSHQVIAGDTLSSIAARSNLSLPQLLELNPQYKADPDTIQVGASINLSREVPEAPAPIADVQTEKPQTDSQRLKETPQNIPVIPTVETPKQKPPVAPTPAPSAQESKTYNVVSGDTLGQIAARNKTTVQSLVEKNKIQNPDLIQVGQVIKL